MRYLFFINPAAGKGILQKKLFAEIEDFFAQNGGEYKIITTRFAGDAEQQARKEAETGENIRMFACGGEGTCYELINGVYGFDNVELGVIPCGSANDFLKVFSSVKPFRELSSQTAGRSVSVDLIRAGERYCINGCSAGMDAMVARDMKLFKRIPLVGGPLAYKLAIARNFLKIKIGVKLNIYVDNDNTGEQNCLFAVIANAPFYGGGYMGAPKALPHDGELDFTCVKTVSHLKVLKFLPHYEKGSFEQFDFCTLRRCESMSFTAEEKVPVNLDGEIIEVSKMDFSIVKNGLKFIIPQGASLPEVTKSEKLLKNV